MIAALALGVAWAQSSAVYVPDTTWAAEDLRTGSDEDQNDVVVRYNARCVIDDATGDLRRHDIQFTPAAAGAAQVDALVLRLPMHPDAVWLAYGTPDVTLACAAPLCADQVELHADFRGGFDDAAPGFVNTAGGPFAAGLQNTVIVDYPPGWNTGMSCPLPDFAVIPPGGGPIDRTTTLARNGQPLVGDFPDFCPTGTCPPDSLVPWAPPIERTAVSIAYGAPFLAWLADRTAEPPCTPGVDCVHEDWFQHPAQDVIDRAALALAAVLAPADTCGDGAMNGEETDIDCGGVVCDACDGGAACVVDADCASGWCDSGICATLQGTGTIEDPFQTVPPLDSCASYATDWGGAAPLPTGSYRIDTTGSAPYRPVYCDFEGRWEIHQQAVNLDLTGTRGFCTNRGLNLAVPTSTEVGALVASFAASGPTRGIRLDMDIQISGDCASAQYGRSTSGAYRSVSSYLLPGSSQCSATYHGFILGGQSRVSSGGFYSAAPSGYHGGSDHRSWTRYCVSASQSGCNTFAAADQGPFPVCSW